MVPFFLTVSAARRAAHTGREVDGLTAGGVHLAGKGGEGNAITPSAAQPREGPLGQPAALQGRLSAVPSLGNACYRCAVSLPMRFKISGTNLSENPAMNPQMIAFAFDSASAGSQ
jgi:hypothetical protein